MDKLDVVLLMSVNPVSAGRSSSPSDAPASAARAQATPTRASGRRIRSRIDGGVKTDNIGEIARAGPTPSSPAPRSFGAAKAAIRTATTSSSAGLLRRKLAAVQA